MVKKKKVHKGSKDIDNLFESLDKRIKEERRLNYFREHFGKKTVDNKERKDNEN